MRIDQVDVQRIREYTNVQCHAGLKQASLYHIGTTSIGYDDVHGGFGFGDRSERGVPLKLLIWS